MKHQIPDDDQERLDILNQWFTEILCSRGYFDDDKWLPIRLNLLKWSQRGYSFRHLNTADAQDFTVIESAKVYRIYNMLSEIDMFSLAIKEVAKSQKFEQAALYRDLAKLCLEELGCTQDSLEFVIPFFKIEEQTLVLKHIDNYFFKQHIKERLRK